MKNFDNKIVKILSIAICLILLSTVVYPSAISKEDVNKNLTKNGSIPKIKDIVYNFLQKLVETFPILKEVKLINTLLQYFCTTCGPDIEIIKIADKETATPGDVITYTYEVTNIGGTWLYDVYVDDDLLGAVTLNETALPPGGWATGTLCYTVTVNDCDSDIVNTAVANGSYCDPDAGEGFVTDSATETVSIECDNNPDIEIIKIADKETATPGDVITYTYTVTNTGDVVLSFVYVDDDLLGSVSLNETSLAPGEWATGTLCYTVTLEDCDSDIVNVALANGSYCDVSGSGYVEDTATEIVSIECDNNPGIEIVKEANVETATVGDVITYTYTVTNTGDVVLSFVYVDDDLLGSVSLNETSLAPGEWATGTLCYTVTLEDCDSDIVNVALANGSYCDVSGSGYVEDTDTETVTIVCGEPAIDLIKKADKNQVSVGDTITYFYTVKNIGDVNLYNVNVTDYPLGPVTLNTTHLAPGEWAYGELTYTVKESDFPGPINNEALAEGYTSTQERVTDDASLSIPFLIPCQEDVWVDNKWHSQSDVNKYNPDLLWEINAFNNFEDAIDVVCECGTVHTRPGTYSEQILIYKSLNLIAEGEVNLNGNPYGFTIDDSTEIVRPIIFAFGGELNGNNVVTTGTISVKVDGFNIYGGSNKIAILYHNVESGCTPALITNNYIHNFDVGIRIQGCTDDTTITWNVIDYPSPTSGKTAILIESINDCEPDNVEIHHNKWGIQCGNNIGVWNKVSNIVNAEFNWWGTDDGPQSPIGNDNYDAITGRIADGFGDEVIGAVHFDPWAGVESSGTVERVPWNPDLYKYDASDSFAYHLDGTPIDDIDYWWDFDDNHYSDSKVIVRGYDSYGTYKVSLRISAIDTNLDSGGFLRDWSYYTINYY